MSENVSNRLEEVIQSTDGPGRMLREARKALQMTEAEISERLNLELKIIESIEADDYSALPPATFTKGYLCAYARMVGLDEKTVTNAFTQFDPQTSPTPLEKPAWLGSQADLNNQNVRWFGALIVMLIIGAFSYWVYDRYQGNWPWDNADEQSPASETTDEPIDRAGFSLTPADNRPSAESGQEPNNGGTHTAPLASASPEQTAPVAPPAAPPVGTVANETDSQAAKRDSEKPSVTHRSASTPAVAAIAPPTKNKPTAQQASPASTTESNTTRLPNITAAKPATSANEAPTNEQPADGASTDKPSNTAASSPNEDRPVATAKPILSLSVSGDCWTSIKDSEGALLVYRVLPAGTALELNGSPPFRITLGNANAASLRFRGEDVDFSRYNKGNIARFEWPPRDTTNP